MIFFLKKILLKFVILNFIEYLAKKYCYLVFKLLSGLLFKKYTYNIINNSNITIILVINIT